MKWKIAIILLVILNVADAASTLYLINLGVVYEANPLMAYLIDIDHMVFLFVKICAVTMCAVALRYCLDKHFLTKIVIAFLLAVYLVVLIVHSRIYYLLWS